MYFYCRLATADEAILILVLLSTQHIPSLNIYHIFTLSVTRQIFIFFLFSWHQQSLSGISHITASWLQFPNIPCTGIKPKQSAVVTSEKHKNVLLSGKLLSVQPQYHAAHGRCANKTNKWGSSKRSDPHWTSNCRAQKLQAAPLSQQDTH